MMEHTERSEAVFNVERQIKTVEVLKMKINKAKLVNFLISVLALLLAGGAKFKWG